MASSDNVQVDKQALVDELNNAYESLFKLNVQHKTGQLTQTHRLRELKKKIARIKTNLREM